MKQELSVMKRATLNTLTLGGNLCTFRALQIPRRAPDRILSATLINGATRRSIAFHGNIYEPPIQDKAIPDNALIEFQYWSRASLGQKQDFYTRQTLYLRGSMNNWQAEDAFVAKGEGRYSARLTLSAGRHEFKVMSKTEGQIDLGAEAANTELALSKNVALAWRGKNFVLVTQGVANYELTLNLQDPEHPMLEVKKLGN